MKKVLPHTDMELEKNGNILLAFSDKCGYSLKLQSNATGSSFSMANCSNFLMANFMGNRWGNSGNSDRLYFLGLQNHCRW